MLLGRWLWSESTKARSAACLAVSNPFDNTGVGALDTIIVVAVVICLFASMTSLSLTVELLLILVRGALVVAITVAAVPMRSTRAGIATKKRPPPETPAPGPEAASILSMQTIVPLLVVAAKVWDSDYPISNADICSPVALPHGHRALVGPVGRVRGRERERDHLVGARRARDGGLTQRSVPR